MIRQTGSVGISHAVATAERILSTMQSLRQGPVVGVEEYGFFPVAALRSE